MYLNLNTAHPVLKNISVRRAIAHAVDRGALHQYYPQGTSDAQTLVSPSFRIQTDRPKDHTDRNQDLSRSLLATAGYSNQVIECYYPADVSPAVGRHPAEGVLRDGGLPHRSGPQHCACAAHMGAVPCEG